MSVTISAADGDDVEQILKLQYLCYQSEAQRRGDYRIGPLTQTLEDLRAEVADGCVLVARLGDEVVGSVRARTDAEGTAHIDRLFVHPRLRRHGLGGRLLTRLEDTLRAEHAVSRFRLVSGQHEAGGMRLHRKFGYEPVAGTPPAMEKPAAPPPLAASA